MYHLQVDINDLLIYTIPSMYTRLLSSGVVDLSKGKWSTHCYRFNKILVLCRMLLIHNDTKCRCITNYDEVKKIQLGTF